MSGEAQLSLGLGHREARGEEDFFEAPCNADALAFVRRWPHWPGPSAALYGPEGSGKSHLGDIWRRRAGAGLAGGADLTRASVPEMLGRTALWLIDPALPLADETALFHLLNAAAENGGGVLLLARTPPARWQVALPDLRSRLAALPVAAIGRPDDTLMSAILVKLFADRQLRVDRQVVAYLLPRIERSFAAARDAVAAVDAAALAERREITVPLLRRVLAAESSC